MKRLFAYILLMILGLFGMFAFSFLFYRGNWLVAFVLAAFLLASIIIFAKKNAYPLRFMYPGLITFFLFLVLPIVFTVLIGFTNLGTGHLLNKDDVKKIIASETYVPQEGEAKNLVFILTLKQDELEIIAQDDDTKNKYFARFKSDAKEIKLSRYLGQMPSESLRKGELFQLFKKIKDIPLVLPSREKFSFQRIDALVNVTPRFKMISNDRFYDIHTHAIYAPDSQKGFYINEKDSNDKLSPGYYVGVGVNNFIRLFSDGSIRQSFSKIFLWTILWSLGSVLLSFSLGMTLALIVNHKGLKGKAFYRVLFIIPYSIPFFISVLVFKGLLNQDFGVINELLAFVGFAKINWLGDPLISKVSCLIVNLWLGFPYMFLVTTGILQSIPNSVYEAAAIDGAKRFATFWHITLPMTFSAIGPLLVGSFAFNLNNFVGIYLLTGGGPPFADATTPAGSTDILISYTYRLAFEGGSGQDFGLASSIAIIIFFIITLLTLLNFKLSGMFKNKESR